MQAERQEVFRFADFSLDLGKGILRGPSGSIPLRAKSFELLVYLVTNGGRVLPKDELIEHVWRRVTVTDESLSQCIHDIRQALNDKQQQLVQTVPRRGYLFSGAMLESIARPLPPADGPADSAATTKPSVMVLPFTNISSDPEQEFFADGVTEDIITDLSKVSGLTVVPRHTSFAYKGQAVKIAPLAKELGVRFVLEGSVRRAGSQLRITGQLVDVSSGKHLWAERYDRDCGDIFFLQDEISQNVVNALKVRLLPGELKAITARSTTSAEAYDCYLQARAIMQLTWTDRAMLSSARKMFERAAQIDPTYAKAYAGIVDCDAFSWISGNLHLSSSALLANATKALELAPDLAETHASMGLALYLSGLRDQAMSALEQAVALDPELWAAHLFYGFTCRDSGKFDKAATAYARAAEINSGDWASTSMLADVYGALGQHELSVSTARRSMARIELAIAQRPDFAEAVAMGAATLVMVGENARAEEWATRAALLAPDSFTVRYNVACVHAVVGKFDLALEGLEHIHTQMPRAQRWLLGMVQNDSQLNSLRPRRDFQTFVGRLELSAAE